MGAPRRGQIIHYTWGGVVRRSIRLRLRHLITKREVPCSIKLASCIALYDRFLQITFFKERYLKRKSLTVFDCKILEELKLVLMGVVI